MKLYLLSLLCGIWLVHQSHAGETFNTFPASTTAPNALATDGHFFFLDSSSENVHIARHTEHMLPLSTLRTNKNWLLDQRGGGGLIPAGYHPFGYKITPLGEQFLEIHKNCVESDVGRFISSLKRTRKTFATLQQEWLEIVRVSKSGQTMRIYRTMKDMIEFCLAARLID
jgi:hypothetical protein